MKIAVGIERFGGCEYARAFVPMMEMQRRGHAVAFADKITNDTFNMGFPPGTPLAMSLKGEAWALEGERAPDVFFCQRLDQRSALDNLRHLQARGTRIVYDLDDNFHAIPSHNPNARDHGPGSKKTRVIDDFVRMCDLFTVSTPGMADEYARIRDGRPMVVCPNAIDNRRYAKYTHKPPYDGAPKREGQIRIGWAGSGTHVGDLRMILPALTAILDEFPQVQMVFVGADMRSLFGERYFRRDLAGGLIKRNTKNRVEFAGESYPGGTFTLPDLVRPDTAPLAFLELIHKADFDIAIAPIESNTFNRSKSYIKALEYGMMSIPMVLSNFGPYREFAQGQGQGACLTADGAASWKAHLRYLIESARNREAFGNFARDHVGRHHLISHVGDTWETALRSITTEQAYQEPVTA